ncbi:hypothetical protein [Pseudoxanthomonas mexicana]|uniref:hypothetical protein n=2 Tax=Pseudoxanthomonas TaxID=83618 RepID=UPI000AC0780A|nr:hypothetical protein [Pseudoxanthomonas mexicana]
MTSMDRDAHAQCQPNDIRDVQSVRDGMSQSTLDDALHLLQADPGHSLADPGLARLTPAGLDRLFLAARH